LISAWYDGRTRSIDIELQARSIQVDKKLRLFFLARPEAATKV